MKKQFLLLSIIAASMSACTEADLSGGNGGVNDEKTAAAQTMLNNIVPTKSVSVPVKEGHKTVVYYGEDVIATTNYATEILVPSDAVTENLSKVQRATSTNAISFEYILENGLQEQSGDSHMYQTVCFEDSRSGENDYNDLVFQAKIDQDKKEFSVSILPIALGNTKPIALGYVVIDENGNEVGRKEMFSNVRTGLFGLNEVEFILSYKTTGKTKVEDGKTYYEYYTKNGKKVYASSLELKNGIYNPVVTLEEGDELIPVGAKNDKGVFVQYKNFLQNPFINTRTTDVEENGTTTTYYASQSFKDKESKGWTVAKPSNSLKYSVVFYIKVDGNKTYYSYSWEKALNSEKIENFITDKGYPMGICVSASNAKKSIFNYPREGVNISTVYKTFDKWLSGEDSRLKVSEINEGTYFDAIGQGLYIENWKK